MAEKINVFRLAPIGRNSQILTEMRAFALPPLILAGPLPLPIPDQSAKWTPAAPVAQLDKSAPSEGKGHTFGSTKWFAAFPPKAAGGWVSTG
jgi:hypothetical protein